MAGQCDYAKYSEHACPEKPTFAVSVPSAQVQYLTCDGHLVPTLHIVDGAGTWKVEPVYSNWEPIRQEVPAL